MVLQGYPGGAGGRLPVRWKRAEPRTPLVE